jgi:hypothetical protein
MKFSKQAKYTEFQVVLSKGSYVPYYSYTSPHGDEFRSLQPIVPIILVNDFYRDYDQLIAWSKEGKTSSEASYRLKQGAHLFNFHLLLNGPLEKKVSQVMTSVLFAILISLVD